MSSWSHIPSQVRQYLIKKCESVLNYGLYLKDMISQGQLALNSVRSGN